ncbi:hypothetical protein JHS3_13580 [Jeongeupia sp. HS-3]|nr:hypothetical protein JHS3_13580 [Jeongeupia sp. HS-3]
MDNCHISKSASFDGEVLKVVFENGEILEITNPFELIVDGTTLKIPEASIVKWSWYLYGEIKSPETLMYYEYRTENGRVVSCTNSPWPTRPIDGELAVELC